VLVYGQNGEERLAYYSAEDLRCWICWGTIKAGYPYTRHPFYHLRDVMTYPACRDCFPFTIDVVSQDTVPLMAVRDTRVKAMTVTRTSTPPPDSLLRKLHMYMRKVMELFYG
jgi:hypothetical protein